MYPPKSRNEERVWDVQRHVSSLRNGKGQLANAGNLNYGNLYLAHSSATHPHASCPPHLPRYPEDLPQLDPVHDMDINNKGSLHLVHLECN